MILLKAIKTEQMIVEGVEYYLGGILQGTNNVVLLDKNKDIVRGSYDSETCFDFTKEELLEKIKKET